MKKTGPGVSVCIIVLNEEDRLPACLRALDFAQEIVIVDGGSTDKTISVARANTPCKNTKIKKRPFDNFVTQKNFALSLATNQWVLVVDADEIVTADLRKEIQDIVHSGAGYTAYRIPRMTFYLGKWIRHCGWYPDYNIRLFTRNSALFVGGTVHERASVTGSVGTLSGHLEHYSYSSVSDHLIRMDHYSSLIAEDKFRKDRWSSPLLAIYKSMSKFFIIFIWRRGFLDGWAGLVVAALGGYYNFLKYIKLWEIRKGLRTSARVRYPLRS